MNQYVSMTGVLHELQAFKKKFYLNLLIKGSIFSVGLLLSFFLVYNLLEYFFYFPYYVRAFLFFSFLGLTIYAFIRWIYTPLSAFINLKKLLTDEQAAQKVGGFYPEIKDKLLNTIQLKDLSKSNDLIAASIEQKSRQLAGFKFEESVKLHENRPLLKYVLVPVGLMLLITLLYPNLFVKGTERIINYKKYYAPEAPFQFVVQNKKLTAFQNEDFTLEVQLTGQTIPNELAVAYNGREQKLTPAKNNTFTYSFQKLQQPITFQLVGSGFYSGEYKLEVLPRPNIKDFSLQIQYPAYLKKAAETIRNTGNVTAPEGSTVTWNFATLATEKLELAFTNPPQVLAATPQASNFTVRKKITTTQEYDVRLQNQYSGNKDKMSFLITSVPDRAPEITLESFPDTAGFNFLVLGGTVADDYGLTRLSLHYRLSAGTEAPRGNYKAVPLPLTPRQISQSYYHQWNVANLKLSPGQQLEYFVQVWDNDGLRGPKSTRTRVSSLKIPSRQELTKDIAANAKSMQSQMSKSVQKAQKLQQEIAQSEEKLKTKKELNWQDKKQMEDLLEKKKQLEQDINAMKEMYDQINQKQDRVDEKSLELAEKTKQLQKLMEDLLDEETKKLYQELEKLLQQQMPNERELQKLLDKLDQKETTLEKELERALELFKQLQFEQKLESATDNLKELAKEEEKLAEKTEDKKAPNQELKQEQQDVQQQFEDVKKELDELEKLNQEMEDKNQLEDTQPEENQIEQEMNKSQESLDKNQNKKAAEAQKKAAEKMQQMAQKMEQESESSSMEEAQQNLDHLRDILENLITLSFDQEELMKSFRAVNQSDPRFISLGQQQLKLKDDAKIIEDSLYALAKKVFQLQSFVTREVGAMNGSIAESLTQIKERNVSKATMQQQMAMTSINNLALMLNDALKQMQQQMAMAAQSQGKGKPKPGSKSKPGDMGKMQQQLNQKMDDLKKGNSSGKALSEELAKLAAEQQRLRQALKELEKQGGKEGQGTKEEGSEGAGGKLDKLNKMMEQTETDLVNKRLTEQTIMRQREILTRLLEAEKSARERDLDNKREAQTAKELVRNLPPSFEKYIKNKERQTELLKTISPAFTPYYKKEVTEYFQKIGK